MEILWAALFIGLLLLEAATTQLVCIWFAGGALFALIGEFVGLSIPFQICIFIIASGLLLVFTRKIVDKLKSKENTKTNVEALIGQSAIVTEDISNLDARGSVKLRGIEWSARSAGGETIEKNSYVTVKEIDGVKLIVDKISK